MWIVGGQSFPRLGAASPSIYFHLTIALECYVPMHQSVHLSRWSHGLAFQVYIYTYRGGYGRLVCKQECAVVQRLKANRKTGCMRRSRCGCGPPALDQQENIFPKTDLDHLFYATMMIFRSLIVRLDGEGLCILSLLSFPSPLRNLS